VVVADHFLHVHPFLRATATGAMIFGGGWVFGTMILGIYLLVSINVFGRHSEEAFSALRIQDYKHFLRIRINKEGGVTIYPIKVEKVPRNWRDRKPGEPSNSIVQPVEPLKAELIERPIVLG
jgi:hypothetical protein